MTTAELHEILDDENRKLTADELKEVVLLLAKAIEQVTVNTYVEQGSAGADEVFKILEQVEKICGKGATDERN